MKRRFGGGSAGIDIEIRKKVNLGLSKHPLQHSVLPAPATDSGGKY